MYQSGVIGYDKPVKRRPRQWLTTVKFVAKVGERVMEVVIAKASGRTQHV
jgi:hypothetical protein